MQKAERILSFLGQQSAKNPNFVFRRIYRYLFNPDFYITHQDPETIDSIIERLRWERYTEGDLYKTPDLKQAVYRLLQAIYQPLTCSCNYKTVREALLAIRDIFPAHGWIIQMPSKHFFQQVPPDVFLSIFSQKIDDGRFLALIRRLLNQGSYDPFWINLMLHELDQWMLNQTDIKIRYIRYQQQIFLLVQETKSEAKRLRQNMNDWFVERLGIEGFAHSAKIDFMARDGVQFLDYFLKLNPNQRIGFYLASSTIRQRLRSFQKRGKPTAHTSRIHLPIQKSISLYQKERRAFETSYALAQNFHKKRRLFVYIHFYSLLKTIARKKNISVKQVRKKYRNELAEYWT